MDFVSYLIAILAADFLSGFFHWLEDSYGTAETPIIGPLIIAPNIDHHRRPSAFLRNSVFGRNWLTVLLVFFLAVPIWWIGELSGPVILGGIVLSFSNEIHAWAHMKDAPALVQSMQRLRIIQTRRHHLSGHHRSPYDACYCVITNILNPILDGCGFWRGIESVLATAGIQKRPG